MTWVNEVVDSAADVGMYPSLKAHSADTLYVAYFDHTNLKLKYAKRQGVDSWHVSTIADAQFKDQISLALNSTAFPYVGFSDPSGFDLKYAYLTKSNRPFPYPPYTWTSSKIADYADNAYGSLAIASDGTIHVSYMLKKSTGWVLAYAKRVTSAQWIKEEIDSVGHTGLFTSIAVDSTGIPHISYYDFDQKNLRYAKRVGNGWTKETIDSPGDVGQCTSIAVGADGSRHIAYYDASNMNLKYAVSQNGWTKMIVDSQGDVGLNPSLALDSGGMPHLSYYDATNQTLKYAKRGFFAPGGWIKETVDSTGNAGRYSSISLDAGGHVHICYYDELNHRLKHAKRT